MLSKITKTKIFLEELYYENNFLEFHQPKIKENPEEYCAIFIRKI